MSKFFNNENSDSESSELEEDYEDKIDLILEWAKSRPNFNTRFVSSVKKYYMENGELTSAQEVAIDNIITKFKIK